MASLFQKLIGPAAAIALIIVANRWKLEQPQPEVYDGFRSMISSMPNISAHKAYLDALLDSQAFVKSLEAQTSKSSSQSTPHTKMNLSTFTRAISDQARRDNNSELAAELESFISRLSNDEPEAQ